MSPSMVLLVFAAIVFAPCLIAHLSSKSKSGLALDAFYFDGWHRSRNRGLQPYALDAAYPELSLSEDFEIRSFPKGISQRRLVVRDTESGPKLSISQVRAAAVELAKLGGEVVAYQYALVAAAAAVVMASFKDAYAVAAREVLESARQGTAWLDWGHNMTQAHIETTLWSEAPTKVQPKKTARLYTSGAWRQAAAAKATRAA